MTKTLDELFDTDPLELTDTDIDSIVAAMREQRKRWDLEEADAKKTNRRPKSPELKQKIKGLSLDDLDL